MFVRIRLHEKNKNNLLFTLYETGNPVPQLVNDNFFFTNTELTLLLKLLKFIEGAGRSVDLIFLWWTNNSLLSPLVKKSTKCHFVTAKSRTKWELFQCEKAVIPCSKEVLIFLTVFSCILLPQNACNDWICELPVGNNNFRFRNKARKNSEV